MGYVCAETKLGTSQFFTVSPCIFYHSCFTHTNSCTCFKLY